MLTSCPHICAAADGICLGLDELMQDLPGLQNSKEPGQADWPYVTAVVGGKGSQQQLRVACSFVVAWVGCFGTACACIRCTAVKQLVPLSMASGSSAVVGRALRPFMMLMQWVSLICMGMTHAHAADCCMTLAGTSTASNPLLHAAPLPDCGQDDAHDAACAYSNSRTSICGLR